MGTPTWISALISSISSDLVPLKNDQMKTASECDEKTHLIFDDKIDYTKRNNDWQTVQIFLDTVEFVLFHFFHFFFFRVDKSVQIWIYIKLKTFIWQLRCKCGMKIREKYLIFLLWRLFTSQTRNFNSNMDDATQILFKFMSIWICNTCHMCEWIHWFMP